jgi:UMP-CMP kinase
MPAIVDKIAHALHLDKSKAVTPKADPSPAAKAAVGKPVTAPGTGATTTTSSTTASTTATASPALDSTKVTVIFVLGGPGAGMYMFIHCDIMAQSVVLNAATGKGTQCAKLVEEFGFCHLSGQYTLSLSLMTWPRTNHTNTICCTVLLYSR